MNEPKTIIQRYFDQTKEATETLSKLEQRAGEVEEQEQRRKAAYADIRDAETDIEQLQQERRELMRFWSEADFEADVQRKAKITKRRLAIDSEVKRLEKEIDRLHDVAEENESDAREVAELAVALDSVTFPNPYDFAEELKKSLWSQHRELSTRKRVARGGIPDVDDMLYEKAKYGEERYEARQRVRALELEEKAEKGRKIRDRNTREDAIAAGAIGDRISTRELKPWEDED